MRLAYFGKYRPVQSFGGLARAWSWSVAPAAAVAALPLILTTTTAYGDTVTATSYGDTVTTSAGLLNDVTQGGGVG